MTIERKIAKIFSLTDENWMRHANPWSVWTRYSVLPIIVLSFWSKLWVGGRYIIPFLLSLLWIFINPILFRKPKSVNNWASKSVLGERVYLNRDNLDIPKHHKIAPKVLNFISFFGLLTTIYGMCYFIISITILGVVITYLGKSWYLDRMVWLYEEMKHYPEYKKWGE